MLIAIDVNGDSVYIAEGSATPGSVEVNNCYEIVLPEGTVEDGVIKNQSALKAKISRLMSAHSFKVMSAVATFISSGAISKRLTLPPGKRSEIAGMVRNQMSQAVGDPSEYLFDYTYITPPQSKTAPVEVWAYAVERETVESFHSMFRSARLRPSALDIHPNSIQKLLRDACVNESKLKGRSTLFAEIERDYIEIHLFNGDERAFSRIAPVSASEFLMIADSLGYGRQNDVSNMETEFDNGAENSIKQSAEGISYGLLDVTPQMLERDTILAEAVRQYTGRIADELQKMIQFQLMRDSTMPVSCVYLYGGLAGIKGIDMCIAQNITCPAEVVKSISKVKINDNRMLYKYLNAMGALIRLK